jgi:hypothetical protein
MPTIEYDLTFIQAGVADLEHYLLSNDLYWQTGQAAPHGEPPFPSLTLGALLLSARRLSERRLSAEQSHRFQSSSVQIETSRTRWRVAWEKKAAREFHARLGLWRDFLGEYRASPAAHASRYAYEVSRRVMLHLLTDEAWAISAEERQQLAALDASLGQALLPGGFLWDADLAPAFPAPTFWYLYGRLSEVPI